MIIALRYTLPLIPDHSTVTEFTKRCGLLPLKDLTIPNYLPNSFNSDGVRFRVNETHIPHLIFDYIITTHQFYSSPYYKPMSEDREKLHNEIRKLHNIGLGYTKIHTHLRKNGFKIGKSRTTVDKILKKMKKRDEFLSQPIIDGIGNFRVEWRRV